MTGCHRFECPRPASDPENATPKDGWLGLLCAPCKAKTIADTEKGRQRNWFAWAADLGEEATP